MVEIFHRKTIQIKLCVVDIFSQNRRANLFAAVCFPRPKSFFCRLPFIGTHYTVYIF